MAGIFAYVAGTPFVYQNIYGVSPQTFSILFGMNGLGLIIGTQVVGRLTGVVSEKRFLESGLFISITSGTLLLDCCFNEWTTNYNRCTYLLFRRFNWCHCDIILFTRDGKARAYCGKCIGITRTTTIYFRSNHGTTCWNSREETAIPMGAIIFASSLIAVIAYFGLSRVKVEQN